MPYVLCPPIHPGQRGLFGEGAAYERGPLYDFAADGPPVHYDQHLLRPHSLPHAESEGHVVRGGATLDPWFGVDGLQRFVGPAVLLRLTLAGWTRHDVAGRTIQHATIGLATLQHALARVATVPDTLERLLLDVTPPDVPADEVAFTLSIEAAQWLCGLPRLGLVGTRFRSTDFQPGSRERPIHRALFARGVAVLECLDLAAVPEGRYVLVSPPLPLAGATESPVVPLLFTPDEWRRTGRGE